MGSCHHPNMVTPQRVMGEMTVPTPHQGTPWAVIWDDIVCLTIRYHETDTLASKTACKSP